MSFNHFERKHAEGFYCQEDIEVIYSLQKGECYFCSRVLGSPGEKGTFHIDHLNPIAKGGDNWPNNLCLACEQCNKSKHSHSSTVLWSKLRKEKGAEWVKAKVQENKKNLPDKRKLTNQRKKERRDSLSLLKQEIEVAISRNIKRLNYAYPKEKYIEVEQIGCFLDITFNNSTASIPAPTQKTLGDWHLKEFDTLAVSLLNLESVAGYIKNA
ncbi:HNH endonuclease [Oceanicoccus sp. KOV_DT_Chl]|uniref:HNH endonuclease n=1 Tax=Oceanicoccus sp. KOV_DT_Chl TaxID=1904639 RepID=UPI000C79E289|nr:HNH endonuclease [Oceanicoccus sp. KOV_DT_Chl]